MILEKHNGAFRVLAGQHFLEGNAVGTIVSYAGTSLPTGYLPCDGAAVSRIVYSELFSCIGTTYGAGDGSTTFNVPNLNDKYLKGSGTKAVGASQAAGLPNIKGSTSGYGLLAVGASDTTGTGAIRMNASTTGKSIQAGDWSTKFWEFDASLSNPIYSDSNTTVDVDAVIVKFCIKYTKTVGAVAPADTVTTHIDANGNMAVVYQEMFNMCHPINSVWVQYTANDNPNTLFNIEGKYSSTWEDISSSFEGRYFKVDNTNTVGTQIEAGLPNINAKLDAALILPEQHLGHPEPSGALSGSGQNNWVVTSQHTGGGYALTELTFNAHNSNAIYDDANTTVTPLTSTIKLWKRTL